MERRIPSEFQPQINGADEILHADTTNNTNNHPFPGAVLIDTFQAPGGKLIGVFSIPDAVDDSQYWLAHLTDRNNGQVQSLSKASEPQLDVDYSQTSSRQKAHIKLDKLINTLTSTADWMGLLNKQGVTYKPFSQVAREGIGAVNNIKQGVADYTRKASEKLDSKARENIVRVAIASTVSVGLTATGVGVSKNEIQKANLAQIDKDMPQTFISFNYLPTTATSLDLVAKDVNLPVEQLKKLNPKFKKAIEIPAGETIIVENYAGVIKTDDVKNQVSKLAEEYNLTEDALRSANGISQNTEVLKPNTTLVLPGREIINGSLSDENANDNSEVVNNSATNIAPEQQTTTTLEVSSADFSNTESVDSTTTSSTSTTTLLETTSTSTSTSEAPTTTVTPNNLETDTLTDSEFIEKLASEITLTPEDYQKLDLDYSRMGVFDDELPNKKTKPEKFVGHWTGALYDDVDHFISSIKSRKGGCCSVEFFIDKNAKIYRLVEDPTQMTYHAKGANSFSQGVEIEARNLRDYTAEQLKSFLVLAYGFMTKNNIPIIRENFVGHQEIDAKYGHQGKPDMPKELVDVLFPKLQELAQNIANQKNGKPENDNLNENEQNYSTTTALPPQQNSTETNGLTSEEQKLTKYNTTLNKLLDLIAFGEGGWDSFNRGDAGDSIGHKFITNGRKLTEITIADVLKLQQARKVIAVGRYQFVPGTLKSAVSSTKIDVNRLFDVNTQNELAINYLLLTKRPGLANFIKGEHNDVALALKEIAKEWASLPYDFGNGVFRSYYHGKANNSARGGKELYSQIKSILEELQTAYVASHNLDSQG